MSPEEDRQPGLTRERLVEAALELVNEEGLEALSMRALADRLEVKAASLYWHVRDRRELLELLAESMVESIPPVRVRGGWRQSVLAAGAALRKQVAEQKDGDRVLLEVRDALHRSRLHAAIKDQLESAGLQPAEAAEVALMVMVSAIAGQVPTDHAPVKAGSPAVDRDRLRLTRRGTSPRLRHADAFPRPPRPKDRRAGCRPRRDGHRPPAAWRGRG